jgi:hypothetical protein
MAIAKKILEKSGTWKTREGTPAYLCGSWGCVKKAVPTQFKATQLVVALAVWADSNVIIFFIASSLAFYWTIITLLS